MKKITARTVCAAILLAAVLAIGQQLSKNQDAHGDQPPNIHANPAENVAIHSHSSTIRTRNSAEITSIGEGISDLPIGNGDISLINEDFILENKSTPGDDYDYIAYNPGYGNGAAGNYSSTNSNSAHAGSGAVSGMAGFTPRKTGQPYAGLVAGGNGGGGYTGSGIGKNEKNAESKNAAGSTSDKGANPNAGSSDNKPGANDHGNKQIDSINPPNRESSANAGPNEGNISDSNNDPGQGGGTPDKNSHSNEPIGTDSPSTSEIPSSKPESNPPYFDSPPGNEPGNLSSLPIPAEGAGNQNHKGAEASENLGEATVSEPAGALLIGLGGIILLWSQRRVSRS